MKKEGRDRMGKAYALFDFDGTLISGDSFMLLCIYARKKGLNSGVSFWKGIGAGIRYLLRLCGAKESKEAALSFLQGKSEKELQQLSADFCREVLRPRLRVQGLAELKARREAGAEVLLITASPAFYFEPLKDELGITEIIGTRMDMGQDGRATGRICGENCKGLQKPLRLAEYLAAVGERLDFSRSYGYGDSASDMPMLELCGHKVGVNVRRGLKKRLAKAEGARLVEW